MLVLNWNRKKFIDPFLKRFLLQSYPQDCLELLFVDNASSDGSADYIKEEYGHLKNLRIVQNDKNYGYAEGNNRGFHQARGQYVLVCNNDLELHKDLVKEMVAVAQSKKAAAVNPKIMFLNKPGIINNAGSRLEPKSSWPVYDIGINEKDEGQYDQIREITALCGACVLFSRSFLKTVGLFDGKFFMYFEDGDLSWRGQRGGYKYYFAPKAITYHVHTGSSKEGSPLFNHFVGRNRILILTKNASYSVLAKAWYITLRDHLLLRLKNIFLSVFRKYPRRQALKEFALSLEMIWAALALTPYALAKRYRIIKEDHL